MSTEEERLPLVPDAVPDTFADDLAPGAPAPAAWQRVDLLLAYALAVLHGAGALLASMLIGFVAFWGTACPVPSPDSDMSACTDRQVAGLALGAFGPWVLLLLGILAAAAVARRQRPRTPVQLLALLLAVALWVWAAGLAETS